jgi:hypothetical protein
MTEESFQWPGRRADDPAHDMLMAFLVIDIQRNIEWAQELLDKIEDVISGKIQHWERIGNAYQINLTRNRARIEDLVDEDRPMQKVTLEDIRNAAKAWIDSTPPR